MIDATTETRTMARQPRPPPRGRMRTGLMQVSLGRGHSSWGRLPDSAGYAPSRDASASDATDEDKPLDSDDGKDPAAVAPQSGAAVGDRTQGKLTHYPEPGARFPPPYQGWRSPSPSSPAG